MRSTMHPRFQLSRRASRLAFLSCRVAVNLVASLALTPLVYADEASATTTVSISVSAKEERPGKIRPPIDAGVESGAGQSSTLAAPPSA